MLSDTLPSLDEHSSCPHDKLYYTCVDNHFRGCCSTDPCDLGKCVDGAELADSDSGQDKGQSPSEPSSSIVRTDSGITHTVPNHSVITVTRHTLVFSEAPSSTPFVDATTLTTESPSVSATHLDSGSPSAFVTRAEADTATAEAKQDGKGAGISSGAMVGTVAGGVIAGAIIVVLIAWKRRRDEQRLSQSRSSALQESIGNNRSEKEERLRRNDQHEHQPMSAHTTGSHGSGNDPFAPFGGRADQPQNPYRPMSGTFEMDGTGMAPVELPNDAVVARSTLIDAPSFRSGNPAQQQRARNDPDADPRANLNSVKTDSGQVVYVNHWSQWKSLGGSDDDHGQICPKNADGTEQGSAAP